MNGIWEALLGLASRFTHRQHRQRVPVVASAIPVEEEPETVFVRLESLGSPWVQVFVNNFPYPPLHGQVTMKCGYPGGSESWGNGTRMELADLAAWYNQAIMACPEWFTATHLNFLRGNLGWSEEIEQVTWLQPPTPLWLEGLVLASDYEVWEYFRRLKEISVDRLFSGHESTYTFAVPAWCQGRPIPKLFNRMSDALKAIGQVEAWGPGCWERAAKKADRPWPSGSAYIGKGAYEGIIYRLSPEIWYPEYDFAARLNAEIDELEQETLRQLRELRQRRQACVAKFKALVAAANNAARGKSGSTAVLRQALREAGLYKPSQGQS